MTAASQSLGTLMKVAWYLVLVCAEALSSAFVDAGLPVLDLGKPACRKEFSMNLIVYPFLLIDDLQCWPLLVICAILIMSITVCFQLVFDPDARMRRKAEKAKKHLDPNYWGSYEK